ncbi:MAG: hypothetical protein KY468_04770 [Armatimonadetes bacterium]|nr:hypothetical protein [Armatimonadota bacterium]
MDDETQEQETAEETQEEQTQETTESTSTETTDDKEQKRQGFEQRQAAKRLKSLEDELAGYKRRDEEARKAQLTEEQRLKEEADTLRQENERLKTERLQQKVAAEFKLPASLAARLIGSDEEALRADAADLAKLLPKQKAGNHTDPTREQGNLPTFKRSQLRDIDFFQKNKDAILQAQREGRIVEG